MRVVLTGSIAYDYLMTFPGRFADHILPERLERLSLSFLVDSLVRRRGGIAANIAYTLALLGERPAVMGTVGEDFEDYRAWLEAQGVDTRPIRVVPGLYTASFFVNTDRTNAQIASFYAGAMAHAGELRLGDLPERPELVVISADDPQAMQAHADEARALGIPFFYDPSQQVVRLDGAALRQGIEGAAGLFVNDYEFELIEHKTGLDRAAAAGLAEILVITRGAEGAELVRGGEHVRVPAVDPGRIDDPTGVGDAFRGGFIKGHLHGLSLERCGQMGALAAAYCLEHSGTQGHRFDLPQFVARFRQHFDDQGELDRLLA